MPAQTYGPSSASPGDMSQANRFTSSFNPAFSFVIDTAVDYLDVDTGPDGFDAKLRILEFGAQSWVDPNAWAYFIGAADEEALNIEEAAVHYTGLGSRSTLRGGRFFVDFGKQMQTHVHELRTLERPLVLRTYLGDEVKGDGLQFDQWYPVGDATAIRWSVGAFSNLLPEEGPDFLPVTAEIEDRKSAGDLNFTARLTGFTDVGESGVFQLGASARAVPEYSFAYEPSGATAEGLSNTVLGLDATYGWTDDTGQRKWTLGGEFLVDRGDNGAEILDPGTPADPTDDTIGVLDDSVSGYFAFVDYAWNPYNSVGIQYSALELPDSAGTDQSEIEVYWSRSFSEYHRLRLVAASFSSDLPDEDSTRLAFQYTVLLGAHGHGVNW
ncbi:MAG: hypothetical protein ACKVXR_13340 [Planctomycetota bacterium]